MSRVVAFWSPGGAGASTLLLNVAAAVASRHHDLVAVDLNLVTPSLALYADLLPYDRPHEACLSALQPAMESGRLTLDDLLRRLLPSTAFPVLPGVMDAVAASRMTDSMVRRLLQLLGGRFRLVLVDLTPALDSVACLPILEMADLICLVTGPDLPARFHTRRYVLPLQAAGWHLKSRLVVNRDGGGLVHQVASEMGLPVALSVPALKGMAGLTEAGRIAYAVQPVSPAVQRFRTSIEQLAAVLANGR